MHLKDMVTLPISWKWKASELKSSVITENTQTLDVKTKHPQSTTYIIQKHHVHFASSNA